MDEISQNSEKLEFLLTKSSHGIFVVMDYGQTSPIIELNKLISVYIHGSISSNQRVDFHPGIFCFPILHHTLIFPGYVKKSL